MLTEDHSVRDGMMRVNIRKEATLRAATGHCVGRCRAVRGTQRRREERYRGGKKRRERERFH